MFYNIVPVHPIVKNCGQIEKSIFVRVGHVLCAAESRVVDVVLIAVVDQVDVRPDVQDDEREAECEHRETEKDRFQFRLLRRKVTFFG